jgi:acyl-CoA synthetase (AMP-forming)/AMP-acid ligase II
MMPTEEHKIDPVFNLWKSLSRWEKPFLTLFSNHDPITDGGNLSMQKRIPGAVGQNHVRLWFYGRKSHRVITSEGTLFTIPCEAVFNRHPDVERSALVGVHLNIAGLKRPVICLQLKPGFYPTKKLTEELLELGSSVLITNR